MSNRRELKKYRLRAALAKNVMEAVESLPRKVGSLVQWGIPGGVIWKRIGDDKWVPLHKSTNYEQQDDQGVFPSDHVAWTWQGWNQIKELPKGTP